MTYDRNAMKGPETKGKYEITLTVEETKPLGLLDVLGFRKRGIGKAQYEIKGEFSIHPASQGLSFGKPLGSLASPDEPQGEDIYR